MHNKKLDTDAFLWALQGICALHRKPFSRELATQQLAAPHTVDSLHRAATAYGFVAQAICVLVGPIFIPFFIVPKLEWLFWGWLKCFMQYAFYQVIAAATMFVMGNLVIYVLTQPPFLPVPDPLTLLTLLIVVFLGGIYALLKVPVLTSHIFSGMSGLNSGAIVEYFLQ